MAAPVALERFPNWALPVASMAVVGAGCAVVGLVDPNRSGLYPTCPVLAVTGLYCPGCGSLRAVYALLHLHPGTALGLNALAVAMVPVLMVLWSRWAARCVGRGSPRRAAPHAIRALLGFVVAWTVARNLPIGVALAP